MQLRIQHRHRPTPQPLPLLVRQLRQKLLRRLLRRPVARRQIIHQRLVRNLMNRSACRLRSLFPLIARRGLFVLPAAAHEHRENNQGPFGFHRYSPRN